MNTFRKLWLPVIATAMLATVLPAQAEVTWSQVQQKIKSAKDYSVKYKYNGPSGKFDFDYRFAGDKVRTEIVDSKSDRSRRGTVIVYDKGWKADKIRARTGGGMIIRNLTHKDVKGKPFHESLFGIILKQTAAAGKPRAKAIGNQTKFTFKSARGSYSVWANDKAEIQKTERNDGKDREVREFGALKWNSSPKMGF